MSRRTYSFEVTLDGGRAAFTWGSDVSSEDARRVFEAMSSVAEDPLTIKLKHLALDRKLRLMNHIGVCASIVTLSLAAIALSLLGRL